MRDIFLDNDEKENQREVVVALFQQIFKPRWPLYTLKFLKKTIFSAQSLSNFSLFVPAAQHLSFQSQLQSREDYQNFNDTVQNMHILSQEIPCDSQKIAMQFPLDKPSKQDITSSTTSSIMSPSTSPLSMPERPASSSVISGRKRIEDKKALYDTVDHFTAYIGAKLKEMSPQHRKLCEAQIIQDRQSTRLEPCKETFSREARVRDDDRSSGPLVISSFDLALRRAIGRRPTRYADIHCRCPLHPAQFRGQEEPKGHRRSTCKRVSWSLRDWDLHPVDLSPVRLTRPPRHFLSTWDIRLRRYTSPTEQWNIPPLLSPLPPSPTERRECATQIGHQGSQEYAVQLFHHIRAGHQSAHNPIYWIGRILVYGFTDEGARSGRAIDRGTISEL